MRSKLLAPGLLATLLWLLASCGGGGGGGGPVRTPTSWTVLVYMTADNNLEADGARDLVEMASVGSGKDLHIVAQVDRAVGQYTGPVLNLADWTSTKRLLVEKGSLRQLADLGEVNMGLTASLASFVSWGVKAYPAEHYMLVLWDHGGGWLGFGWDDSAPVGGVADHLSLDRIAAGLKQGLAGTGVAKLDILGFDACLMATLEVAETVKPYASHLLASEEVEPGHGWNWGALAGADTLDPIWLGRQIADGYLAQARAAGDDAGVTLSLVDLSRLAPVEAALSRLAASYGTAATMLPVLGGVASGRRAAVEYGASPNPAQAYSLFDMAGLFGGMTGVSGAAEARDAVAGAVVYQVVGPGRAGSGGLSLYYPPSAARYAAAYDALPGMASWRTFLKAVYAGGATEPTPSFSGGRYAPGAGGLTLVGDLVAGTEGGVQTAAIAFGVPDGSGGAWLYGDAPAATSGSAVTGQWDWSVLHLFQGSYQEYGYLWREEVGPGLTAVNVPLAYDPPGSAALQLAVWRVVWDAAGNLLANNVFLHSGGGVAELTAVPGSRLRALLIHMPVLGGAGSWALSAPSGVGLDTTQPFSFDLPRLRSGSSYIAMLSVQNSAGLGDWIWTPPATVP